MFINKSSKIKSTDKISNFNKIEVTEALKPNKVEQFYANLESKSSSRSSYDSDSEDLISKRTKPKIKMSCLNLKYKIAEEGDDSVEESLS